MGAEEIARIKEYGERLERERQAAAKPPPPPPQVPWAKENPCVRFTDAGTFLNVPMIRRLLFGWQGNLERVIEDCGIELRSIDGGRFVRAEALVAAFDAGIFGRGRVRQVRILKVNSLSDMAPVTPPGMVRQQCAADAFDGMSGKVFPEVLLSAARTSVPGVDLPSKMWRGGDPDGIRAVTLEAMVPFEVGLQDHLCTEPEGQLIWLWHLPRAASAERHPAECAAPGTGAEAQEPAQPEECQTAGAVGSTDPVAPLEATE